MELLISPEMLDEKLLGHEFSFVLNFSDKYLIWPRQVDISATDLFFQRVYSEKETKPCSQTQVSCFCWNWNYFDNGKSGKAGCVTIWKSKMLLIRKLLVDVSLIYL